MSAFDRRQAFEMEYRLRRHDGAWRWIFDRGVPFTTDDGEFAGYIGSCVDVTERREAQQALARTAELELQMLRGILPICSHCKRIRDGDGSWSQIEGYVARHSAAEFSHGICPSCMHEHYPDLMDDVAGPA